MTPESSAAKKLLSDELIEERREEQRRENEQDAAHTAPRFDLDDVLDKLYAARALLTATPPEPTLALMNVESVIQAVDPDA